MIYCVSDIHGKLDLFEKLLDTINLNNNDTLYILGDAIDRFGGLSVLLRIKELSNRGNVRFIKGNHEILFADNIEMYEPNIEAVMNNYVQECRIDDAIKVMCSIISSKLFTAYNSYDTCNDYFKLSKNEQRNILRFINDSPLFEDITVSGKKYRLTHSGCNRNGKIENYIRQDFFKNASPIHDKTIVFGHTTTKDIRMLVDGVYTTPKIWFDTRHNNDKIGIDCGAGFYGGRLACLRLNDMKEFYIENDQEMQSYINRFNKFIKENELRPNCNYEYLSNYHKYVNDIFEIEQKLEANYKNEYGEYYEYILQYPSLPEIDKKKWVILLKILDNAKQMLDINPEWEYAKKSLQEAENKLNEFYKDFSIDVNKLPNYY